MLYSWQKARSPITGAASTITARSLAGNSSKRRSVMLRPCRLPLSFASRLGSPRLGETTPTFTSAPLMVSWPSSVPPSCSPVFQYSLIFPFFSILHAFSVFYKELHYYYDVCTKFPHFSVFLKFYQYLWSEFSKNTDKSVYLEALLATHGYLNIIDLNFMLKHLSGLYWAVLVTIECMCIMPVHDHSAS